MMFGCPLRGLPSTIDRVWQAIESAKVDKTDKPFSEMKIISIDIS